jgi:hypothetical protein
LIIVTSALMIVTSVTYMSGPDYPQALTPVGEDDQPEEEGTSSVAAAQAGGGNQQHPQLQPADQRAQQQAFQQRVLAEFQRLQQQVGALSAPNSDAGGDAGAGGVGHFHYNPKSSLLCEQDQDAEPQVSAVFSIIRRANAVVGSPDPDGALDPWRVNLSKKWSRALNDADKALKWGKLQFDSVNGLLDGLRALVNLYWIDFQLAGANQLDEGQWDCCHHEVMPS